MKKIYHEWEVIGFVVADQGKMRTMPKRFIVRYTSDKVGKSLSINDVKSKVMFQIPFDVIEQAIKEDEQNG